MEEFQGPDKNNPSFEYPIPDQAGSNSSGNQPLQNHHLANNFNQFANYTISPQHSITQQPQPGYTYDPAQPYNHQPVVYNNQTSIDWNAAVQQQTIPWLGSTSPQPSLVHSGTSSAVNSSRWTSTFNNNNLASLTGPAYNPPANIPWEPEPSNSLSSSARLKPFIEKLYNILAQPSSFRDCLVWDEAGTCFIVSHANPRLLAQVLPDAFGHSNLHSFTRQLNIYGFTRCTSAELLSKLDVTSTSDYSGWRHPLFTRHDPSQLHLLNPRPSRARQLKKDQKVAQDAEKDLDASPPQ